MKKITNINVKIGLAIASFIAAIAFGAWGMCVPPPAIIDKSVLIFCAQLFIMSGTFLGLNLNLDLQNKKFQSSVNDRLDEDEKDIVKIQKAIEKDEIRRKEIEK